MRFIGGKRGFRVVFFLIAFVIAFVPTAVYSPAHVQAATTLKVYPAPAGVPLNTYYTVKVREQGGAWQDLDEYMTWVNGYSGQTASFVYFDTDGPVELSVTNNNGDITSANIRPSNKNITPAISGNTMTFTISGPMKLSAAINGDINNTVDIFANPLEVNPPSPTDPNVIYLGPGYYNQDYVVPSGKTLYIAGGAVVKGSVIMDNAVNAKVIGRGVLDRPVNRGVSADYANQITIDGIIVNNFADGNSGGNAISLGAATNVTVNNFKSYSRKRWSDGVDTFSASNISFNDLFMRNGDDAIAIYGSRFNSGMTWTGNLSKNISVTNSILFPDIAHPINIGTHGDPSAPGGGDTIENLTFKNIDIFGNYTRHPISLTSSDGNLVTNATFEDIRIEGNSVAQILEILTYRNAGFSTAPGRGINNILFKNVTYNGSIANQTQIKGQDSTRLTQNVTFENLVVNGNVVTDASGGNFNIGSYTSNINFIASGGSVPAPTPIPPYTLTNLALNKSASSDSTQSGHSSSNGNDGSTTTLWTANDGNTGHWWKVDLGSSMNITGGTQVMWEFSGKAYQYKIETSNDDINWTLQVDKTANTSTDQIQSDIFYDNARYVRITVTGLASGAWASIYDFKVLGNPTNLALGRSASSDSTQSGNPVSNGNDGNAATLWRANDGNTGHSWTVDLGASKTIAYGTQVMWPTSGAAYQYKVETSTDNTNWTITVDKTGNTDTSQVINDYFTGTARYVRITVTGLPSGENAGFYEFKVLGDPTNLALNRTVSTDSEQSGNPAVSGNDGSTTTRWSANDGSTGHWWTVDLGAVKNITGGTQVMWETIGGVYKYNIDISDDNTNWTTKVWKTSNHRTDQVQSDYFTGTARYVRITVTGLPSGANASIYEFKVFGTVDGPTFFKDTNYGGASVTLGSGYYTLAQMQLEGITDNSISSIQVPEGYTVVAYDGGAFDGTSWMYTSDNTNMDNTGNNDMISSIKVLSAGPTFYSNTSFGGTAVTLGAGEYTLAQLQAAGIANNSISSIRVPVGYTVVAYDGSAFDGTSWTFTSDNSSLVNTGNNDMISSIIITINDDYLSSAATIASEIASIPTPAKDATSIVMPEVPSGYTVSIKSTSPSGIIGTDGTISQPDYDTEVKIVFTVTKLSDGTTADTGSIVTLVTGKIGYPKINVSAFAKVTASDKQWPGTGLSADQVGYLLFDGNPATAGDLNSGSGAYYIVDFGAGNSVQLNEIKLLPRTGVSARLNGLVIQGSNDNTTWTNLTQPVSGATDGTWIDIRKNTILDYQSYRYIKLYNSNAWYGNVAEVEFYGDFNFNIVSKVVAPDGYTKESYYLYMNEVDRINEALSQPGADKMALMTELLQSQEKLESVGSIYPKIAITSSMAMASSISWDGKVNAATNGWRAFDGNTSTSPDTKTGAGWSQADLGEGNAKAVGSIRFMPRAGNAARMNGALIQGSNDGVNFDTLYTISGVSEIKWYTQIIDSSKEYRYLRYYTPNGFANVGELEFYEKIVDRTLLAYLLNQANAVVGSQYTADSYAALQTAVTNAQTAAVNASATQTTVDAAVSSLKTALNGLIYKIEASVDPTEPNGLNGWYTTPVTITLSTLGSAEYKLNDEETWHRYTTPIVLDQGGAYTVSYRAEGSDDAAQTVTVKIDRTAPVSIASISPDVPNGNNGWYNSEVTVSLHASDDASGAAVTEYQINDGAWMTYNGSIPAFGDGIYTVNYRSTDLAGNVGQIRTIEFKVDTKGPSLAVNLDRTSIWPPNHNMATILAEVNGSDSLSGIESIVLSSITSNEPDEETDAEDQPNDIQDAEMGTFDSLFSLRAERSGEGTGRIYTITYTATDKAGNQTVVSVTVTVPHDKSGNQ